LTFGIPVRGAGVMEKRTAKRRKEDGKRREEKQMCPSP